MAGRGSRYHYVLNRKRWERVRRFVFEWDGYRCTSCGRRGRLECDHITPLQKEPGQDTYDPNGLQTLCRFCHIEKTSRENTRPLFTVMLAWRALVSELTE